MIRIVFAGGGSGGHFFPILAIIRKFKKLYPEFFEKAEFFYIAPSEFGFDLMEKEGVKCILIKTGKLRRYFSVLNFIDVFKFFVGWSKSNYILWKIMPDLVFSKGGYGAFPVLITSFLYRIPFVIHESDTIPGLANKIFSRFSLTFFGAFDITKNYISKSAQKKFVLVGNPIREEIIAKNVPKEESLNFLNINTSKKIILVLGGSQGSQTINNLIFSSANKILKNYFIIHQAGPKKSEKLKQDLEKFYKLDFIKENIKIYDFLDEQSLKHSYNLADLVVSRAGAGSIFEIAINKKPSILIPLEGSAGNHQKINAYEYAKTGATLVIEEENLKPGLFYDEVNKLLEDDSLLQKMKESAGNFIKFDPAEEIVKYIQNLKNIFE